MAFQKGEFVRVRRGTGTVGVVWDIQPQHISSVTVYFGGTTNVRTQQDYEPKELELVPPHAVPEYALRLKESLGL